ncbi:membrane protein insertion efficiency factor YidD [Xanthobacter agilis]|uniref:Putative membrane protein insertion efficiency factor n=1 Tax=Xanthobacter agilis TaxID=47492 RepID=A0ABU0L9Z8_XANAG|nr:membrane protein insertion efficiency factor YidD [Xanthobacter agilis]MDQ0503961.1 putative membrane protein insertion efficiency factor [Xanthobacter agilis]
MPPSDGPSDGSPLDALPWSKPESSARRGARLVGRAPRLLLRVPILLYRYTLSSFMGRQCRYLPTCSEYADEAISRHGAWPGLFMATARVCRCHPWGGHGYDPVPKALPAAGRWYAPWRYGRWRFKAEPVRED